MCSVSLFLPPCARTDPSFNGSQRISAASRKGRLGCNHATPPHRNFCEQRAHHDTQREPAGVVVHTRRRRLGFQTSLLVATAKGGVQAICNRITITPPLCSNSRVPSNPSRQYPALIVGAFGRGLGKPRSLQAVARARSSRRCEPPPQSSSGRLYSLTRCRSTVNYSHECP